MIGIHYMTKTDPILSCTEPFLMKMARIESAENAKNGFGALRTTLPTVLLVCGDPKCRGAVIRIQHNNIMEEKSAKIRPQNSTRVSLDSGVTYEDRAEFFFSPG